MSAAPPGGAAPSALNATQPAVAASSASSSSSAATGSAAPSGTPATIEDHMDKNDRSQKFDPSAPVPASSTGYLQAKINYNKPMLAQLLGECPPPLKKFLPYDSSYERTLVVIKKWYKADSGTYSVQLLPAQSEIDSAELNPLYKVVMAFVKERLGLRDQQSNVFAEKVTSSSVIIACVAFTTLVRVTNGCQGVELISMLTAFQSFVSGMQNLLLDKFEADNLAAKMTKSLRGKSNDPSGQSAFACLNQCSLQAERKKKEMRQRCFKEALPRVDGIHQTLSHLRKSLLLLFLRMHHNKQLPSDFDYLLNGEGSDTDAVDKQNPIFQDNKDLPIGLSADGVVLLKAIKADGLFHQLYNVHAHQLTTLLDVGNANAVVETSIGARSVIDQCKGLTYSLLLGEKGFIQKLKDAHEALSHNDRSALMYPMLMAEFESCPSLFLVCVILRKMTTDLFMTQIQLANLTPIVASEAIEAYTLALAEFGTNIRDFATRLIAARDHIAGMSRFGFVLNYAGTELLGKLVAGQTPNDVLRAESGRGDSSASSSSSSSSDGISPQGVKLLLNYWQTLTQFKTDHNSLRFLNDLGRMCEDLKAHVDTLFEHIKLLRNSTDVVKSYAMMEQAIMDLRKFSNGVTMATGTPVKLHDSPLVEFKHLLAHQAQLVTQQRASLKAANNVSLALNSVGGGANLGEPRPGAGAGGAAGAAAASSGPASSPASSMQPQQSPPSQMLLQQPTNSASMYGSNPYSGNPFLSSNQNQNQNQTGGGYNNNIPTPNNQYNQYQPEGHPQQQGTGSGGPGGMPASAMMSPSSASYNSQPASSMSSPSSTGGPAWTPGGAPGPYNGNGFGPYSNNNSGSSGAGAAPPAYSDIDDRPSYQPPNSSSSQFHHHSVSTGDVDSDGFAMLRKQNQAASIYSPSPMGRSASVSAAPPRTSTPGSTTNAPRGGAPLSRTTSTVTGSTSGTREQNTNAIEGHTSSDAEGQGWEQPVGHGFVSVTGEAHSQRAKPFPVVRMPSRPTTPVPQASPARSGNNSPRGSITRNNTNSTLNVPGADMNRTQSSGQRESAAAAAATASLNSTAPSGMGRGPSSRAGAYNSNNNPAPSSNGQRGLHPGGEGDADSDLREILDHRAPRRRHEADTSDEDSDDGGASRGPRQPPPAQSMFACWFPSPMAKAKPVEPPRKNSRRSSTGSTNLSGPGGMPPPPPFSEAVSPAHSVHHHHPGLVHNASSSSLSSPTEEAEEAHSRRVVLRDARAVY